LLVTNCSVHSQSAKDLVTDLFKRQADDSKLTRGEALRHLLYLFERDEAVRLLRAG